MALSPRYINTTGVQISPPSPVDNTPPSSRHPSPLESHNARSSPVSSQVRSVKQPPLNSHRQSSRAFDIQPPTAPRSMRQNISPPPLKRSETYRYDRDARRFSDEFSRDTWTSSRMGRYPPSSPRRRGASRDRDSLWRRSPPRIVRHDYEHTKEPPRVRRTSVPRGYKKEEKGGREKACPIKDGGKAKAAIFSTDAATRELKTSPLPAVEVMDGRVGTSAVKSPRKGPSLEGTGRVNEDLEEGEWSQDGTEKDTQFRLATSAVVTPSVAPYPDKEDGRNLTAQENQSASGYGASAVCEREKCVKSIETDTQIAPPPNSGTFLKPSPLVIGSTLQDDVASTPSTDTASSRSKTICRACRKPGSTLTRLVLCKLCQKGYHDYCGNPKPQQR